MSRISAAILISGSGTNLQAFIDAVQDKALDLDIALVLSNRADAAGLERARKAGIPTACISNIEFADREQFDAALALELDRVNADLIILAGFMRILTAAFVAHFEGRILNIHPSLLPAYPGLHTHQRVIDAGDAWHGSTVHFVTAELDGGPPIIQARVPVMPDDDADTLAARVLNVEHRIYPQAAALIAAGRLKYRDGSAWLDGELLLEPILFETHA